MRYDVVGPHSTCSVGIGSEGESRAHMEGCRAKGGGPRVSTLHLEYSKWGVQGLKKDLGAF